VTSGAAIPSTDASLMPSPTITVGPALLFSYDRADLTRRTRSRSTIEIERRADGFQGIYAARPVTG